MQRRQLVKALLTLTIGTAIGGLPFAALAKPGRPASVPPAWLASGGGTVGEGAGEFTAT